MCGSFVVHQRQSVCLCLYVNVPLIIFLQGYVQIAYPVRACVREAPNAHRLCRWIYCECVESSLDDP